MILALNYQPSIIYAIFLFIIILPAVTIIVDIFVTGSGMLCMIAELSDEIEIRYGFRYWVIYVVTIVLWILSGLIVIFKLL